MLCVQEQPEALPWTKPILDMSSWVYIATGPNELVYKKIFNFFDTKCLKNFINLFCICPCTVITLRALGEERALRDKSGKNLWPENEVTQGFRKNQDFEKY